MRDKKGAFVLLEITLFALAALSLVCRFYEKKSVFTVLAFLFVSMAVGHRIKSELFTHSTTDVASPVAVLTDFSARQTVPATELACIVRVEVIPCRALDELNITRGDLDRMFASKNISLVFTGSDSDIPAKLRPKIWTTTAPTTAPAGK